MVSFLNFPYRDIMSGKYDVKPAVKSAKDFIPLVLDLLDNHPELRSVGSMTRYLFRNENSDCAVWLSGKISWFNSVLIEYITENPNDPINFVLE